MSLVLAFFKTKLSINKSLMCKPSSFLDKAKLQLDSIAVFLLPSYILILISSNIILLKAYYFLALASWLALNKFF